MQLEQHLSNILLSKPHEPDFVDLPPSTVTDDSNIEYPETQCNDCSENSFEIFVDDSDRNIPLPVPFAFRNNHLDWIRKIHERHFNQKYPN